MKYLILLLVLLSLNVSAYTPLPVDAIALSKLESVKLVSVLPYRKPCPSGARCQPATQVTIEFTLLGCLDELGPVSIASSQVDNNYTVYVSAINIHTEASTRARCSRPKKVEYRFFARPFLNEEEIILEVLR
jgi:hypothetical protein